MPFINVISEEDATGIVDQVYKQGRARAGGVANIIRIQGQHGKTLQASMQFYVVLMIQENALPKRQKEMLATVVSNINDCYY